MISCKPLKWNKWKHCSVLICTNDHHHNFHFYDHHHPFNLLYWLPVKKKNCYTAKVIKTHLVWFRLVFCNDASVQNEKLFSWKVGTQHTHQTKPPNRPARRDAKCDVTWHRKFGKPNFLSVFSHFQNKYICFCDDDHLHVAFTWHKFFFNGLCCSC